MYLYVDFYEFSISDFENHWLSLKLLSFRYRFRIYSLSGENLCFTVTLLAGENLCFKSHYSSSRSKYFLFESLLFWQEEFSAWRFITIEFCECTLDFNAILNYLSIFAVENYRLSLKGLFAFVVAFELLF